MRLSHNLLRAAPLIVLAALAACLGVAFVQAPIAAASASPSRGAQLYEELGCASCHGADGEGARGPRLAGAALPRDAFIAAIRTPANEMPPYGPAVADDDDLAAVYIYLRGVR